MAENVARAERQHADQCDEAEQAGDVHCADEVASPMPVPCAFVLTLVLGYDIDECLIVHKVAHVGKAKPIA